VAGSGQFFRLKLPSNCLIEPYAFFEVLEHDVRLNESVEQHHAIGTDLDEAARDDW
jgi:hypothetical protein